MVMHGSEHCNGTTSPSVAEPHPSRDPAVGLAALNLLGASMEATDPLWPHPCEVLLFEVEE